MATYYLINTTQVNRVNFPAGEKIDDTVHNVSRIQGAGAILWPVADAIVAAQAVLVQSYQKNRGITNEKADQLMLAAVAASLAAGASIVAASSTVPGTMSAADKKFLDTAHAASGGNIADADGNVNVAGGYWQKLPTLTGNRSLTIQTAGAVAGDQLTITRTSSAANTAAIINGGSGAGTIYTFPASKVGFVQLQFDGTDWAVREVGVGS